MRAATSPRPARPGRLVLLVAHAGEHPRVRRLRAAFHPVGHVFQSGAANGAISAFGWRGVAVVPIVMAASLLLTRLLGRRRLA
ncbi:hypothetical protein [uncultured Amnibacterium sp.]|uniref:hypothetical protein n=1 Tax=uncultured Amnibacterium sp. TaxID=1631851 RepID=UPI0035CA9A3B